MKKVASVEMISFSFFSTVSYDPLENAFILLKRNLDWCGFRHKKDTNDETHKKLFIEGEFIDGQFFGVVFFFLVSYLDLFAIQG